MTLKKHKDFIKYLAVGATIAWLFLQLIIPAPVSAAPIPAGCPGSTLQGPPAPGSCAAIPPGCPGSTAAGPKAPGVTCPYEASTGGTSDAARFRGDCKDKDLTKDCAIVEYIRAFVKVLSGIVGIVIVIMIAVGGVQYSAARDNPQAVAAARGRITNAVIALVSFIFMFSVLQWLVPGGIL